MVPIMNIDKAYLIGYWLEAVLYGINSVLVWACLFVLIHKKGRKRINKFILAAVVLQYLISTADVSLGLTRLVIAFINNQGVPGGAIGYFADLPNPIDVAELIFISMNSVINDTVIVWRVYHVWGKNWKVAVFPFMLVVGTFGCAIGQGVSFRILKTHNPFDNSVVVWNNSFYSLSISTNIISTILIAYRIWSMFRNIPVAGAAYTKVLALVIESGMIYSTTLLIGLGLYIQKNGAFYIVYQQFGQLGAIMPTMILLLVGLRLTANDVKVRILSTNVVLSSNIEQTATPSNVGQNKSATTLTSSNLNFSKPVAIDVTNAVHYMSEDEFETLPRSGDRAIPLTHMTPLKKENVDNV